MKLRKVFIEWFMEMVRKYEELNNTRIDLSYEYAEKLLNEVDSTIGKLDKLIKELEKERDNRSPDKYGYIEYDIYKSIIKRLKKVKGGK